MRAPATVIHSRETQSVRRLLNGYGVGAHLLGIACGTGKVLPLLIKKGFEITAADCSRFMIEKAVAGIETVSHNRPDRRGAVNISAASGVAMSAAKSS